ncbi:MAG TPA: hypothetical protein ENG03_02795 [Thioploca sp.]|nr:MAG: hypothetical protein DRR08_31450 [Gammaproteobacteria bacterium]HDN26024.1 hypothetical protein [Thioploca sp.]
MKPIRPLFCKLQRTTLYALLSFLFAAASTAQTEPEMTNSNILFDWAEKQYPQFFSPSNTATQSILGYLARHYVETEAWLGTTDGQVYVYGEIFNEIEPVGLSIKPVGEVSFYLSLAQADSSLIINEIVAKAADGGSDWFELYAAGKEAVYLGDYTVVDDKAGREPMALPEVTLAPGQFVIVYATYDKPADGSPYVSFKLGASDSVTLFKGSELIDLLKWQKGDAPSGFSYGHLPDGTGEAQTLKPTPGAANEMTANKPTAPVDNPEDPGNKDLEVFNRDKVVEVYIELKPEDWQAILDDPLAKEYKPSTITYNGVKLENVAFRTKGKSSLMNVAADNNSGRYSFKVDMDLYVEGQTLSGLKKLNFNNNWREPSYMREYISYDLMRYMDLPAPRIAYVNLYINDVLHGFYTVVEHVDSVFVNTNFANGEGDLYKPEGKGSDLLWISDNFSDYSGIELKTNEDSSDNAAFMTMIDVLNNGTDYESVLNVDGFLRYIAVNTAVSNWDFYPGNYYLYEQAGVFSIIPWDLNRSFGGGGVSCLDEKRIELLIYDPPTSSAMSQRPLIDKLLQNADYREAYYDHFETLLNGPLNPDTMAQTINDTAALIRDFVYADPSAFYTPEEFEASLTEGFYYSTAESTTEPTNGMAPPIPWEGYIGLKSFVEQRVSNLRDQLDGVVSDGYSDSCIATESEMTAPVPSQRVGNGGQFPEREADGIPPDRVNAIKLSFWVRATIKDCPYIT